MWFITMTDVSFEQPNDPVAEHSASGGTKIFNTRPHERGRRRRPHYANPGHHLWAVHTLAQQEHRVCPNGPNSVNTSPPPCGLETTKD